VAQFQQRELVRDKIVVPAFFSDAAVKKTFLDFLLDVLLMVPLRLDDARYAHTSPQLSLAHFSSLRSTARLNAD
jgi:hypothetical protein